MLRFTRILATRLHRCAAPARRAVGVGQERGDAWSRLDLAVTALTPSAEALRRRELSQENVRLAVTLIGQQGARVIDRVMLACEGDLGLDASAQRLLLTLARALGDEETREAAARALAAASVESRQ